MFIKGSDSTLPPSRLVVVGSRGFVGSNLVGKAQALGWNVLPLSSKEIDLTECSSLAVLSSTIKPTDTVVFISALTPDKGRDRKTLLANFTMADNVCGALEKTPCAHVIYVSSDAVYDDAAHPVRESSSCNPSSFHGIMHLTREKMLLEATKRLHIPLLIVRPCAVYGKGDTHNSYGPNRFLKTALEKKEIAITGEGEELRDHLFIDDLVLLITETIGYRATGVVNAASGTTLSFKEVATEIKANMPHGLASSITITSTPRQSPVTHRHFDVSELLRSFPTFQFTAFKDGIKKSF